MGLLKLEKLVTLELTIQELIVALLSALILKSDPSVEKEKLELAESLPNAEEAEIESSVIKEETSQRVKDVEVSSARKLATPMELAQRDNSILFDLISSFWYSI